MTPKQSTARLCLYAAVAFLTPIASNWEQMASASPYQWGGMFMQALITSLIAVRAYIDQTPTQINQ